MTTTTDKAIEALRWLGSFTKADSADGQFIKEALGRLEAERAALSTPAVPAGHVLVPESALRWLFGEEGRFECPPNRYFRGKPPAFWWRGVFRDLLAAAPQQPAGPVFVAAESLDDLDKLNQVHTGCLYPGSAVPQPGPAVQGEAPLGAPIAPEHDAELAAMSAEAEVRFTEMAQDAARYRALRATMNPTARRSMLMPTVSVPFERDCTYSTPEALDAAIDAAMQAQGGEK